MRLVVLDRDGVLNHDSPDYIKSPDEWRPIDGAAEAVARLCRDDYRVVVATNQSGVGRGLMSIDDLNRIHLRMLDHIRAKGGDIDAILFCPHHPERDCACRKPRPGMFETLARRLNVSLGGVPAVGDRVRDLEAARAAGASPVLVLCGANELGLTAGQAIADPGEFSDVPVFADLAAFADALLAGELGGGASAARAPLR